jgi:DNA-binding NarL/FixJ family response regulator
MKIAIVDDHQIIIDGIEMLLGLEKNIAILKTYTDACDFLQDMREGKINPDLLLMDLMMPTMNGFECAKVLKQEFPNLKIIILSMNCDPKVVYELVAKLKISDSLSGRKLSNEHKQNIVNGITKRINSPDYIPPNKGRTWPDEYKTKMSEVCKTVQKTDEWNKKNSIANTGRVHIANLITKKRKRPFQKDLYKFIKGDNPEWIILPTMKEIPDYQDYYNL